MKKIFENAVWWSGVVAAGIVLGVSLQFVKAWSEPTADPPGGNVGAPINTSVNPQTKGDFWAGTGSLALGGVLDALAIRIRGGTPQPGMVLTAKETFPGSGVSDGTAAWAAGGGGGLYQTSCDTEVNFPAGGGRYSACCRMKTDDATTQCKFLPSETVPNVDWGDAPTPGAVGSYSLACGITVGDSMRYILCCRTKSSDGKTKCKTYNTYNGLWSEEANPF